MYLRFGNLKKIRANKQKIELGNVSVGEIQRKREGKTLEVGEDISKVSTTILCIEVKMSS